MTNDERRPLVREDYERAYAVIVALRTKVVFDDDRTPWEILRDLHSDDDYGLTQSQVADLVGDEAADREIRHALIALEMLMQGESTIRTNAATNSVYTRCATPGCNNPTVTNLCWHCELGLPNK